MDEPSPAGLYSAHSCPAVSRGRDLVQVLGAYQEGIWLSHWRLEGGAGPLGGPFFESSGCILI